MPRYHFDVRDSDGFHRDSFGEVFADLDEARALCQGLLSDVISEQLPNGDLHTITCDVRDESGRVVYQGEITFRGTLPPA